MLKRHLITSALPYINGVKHLGNLIGSMLPADVYARFLRLTGEEVLFICATDEHGTPAELAAYEAGLSVVEYCRREHEVQSRLCQRFLLSFDHFGRSSSAQNRVLTQHFGRLLDQKGLVEERDTLQVYSVSDRRFLPDRYVMGTCPSCGYERARGDQCENCTRVLDPTDLLEPRSAITGASDLEIRESRHLFLRLSVLEPMIRAWIESVSDAWPPLVSSIARKWLAEGLHDRPITRDLQWGVPVDRPGFENKVYYVWFDAPIEYIGSTKEWSDRAPGSRSWEAWWCGAPDVEYTQFMAKDNVPFHTITWPAVLLGVDEGWKLPDYIKGFNWLNYEGGKFSTTLRQGVFMDSALELLPADYWRWVLCANAPEASDSNFSFPILALNVNRDLVGLFGNFVNRAMTLTKRNFGDAVPPCGEMTEVDLAFLRDVDELLLRIRSGYSDKMLRKTTGWIRELWTLANSYMDKTEPWRSVKSDRDRAGTELHIALNAVAVCAAVARPIIPASAAAVLAALKLPESTPWPDHLDADLLPSGHPFTVPELLFRKVTDEEVAEWTVRFAGSAIASDYSG